MKHFFAIFYIFLYMICASAENYGALRPFFYQDYTASFNSDSNMIKRAVDHKFTFINNKYVKFNSADSSSDLSNDAKIKDNIITKDLDWSWYKEQYRMEKIFIASGIVSSVIGLPFLIVGIVNLALPTVDVSSVGNNTYYSLIGVGAGLITIGMTFTIVGGVRYKYFNKKKVDTKSTVK